MRKNISRKKCFLFTVFSAFFLLMILPAAGGNLPAASIVRTQDSENVSKELTPEQTLNIRNIGDLRLSPGGDFIALTVSEPVRGSGTASNIWMYDVKNSTLTRFTTSKKRDYFPRWEPGGTRLAFLSQRSGKTQIHLIRADGGEAVPFTHSETNIFSFRWSPDGKRIAFMADEPETEKEKKGREEKDDARVADRDDKPSRLWIIDLDSADPRRLTKGDWRVSSYDWLPDGEHLIISATDSKKPELLTGRIYRISLKYGTLDRIAEPALPFGRLKVSTDGKRLAYLGAPGDGPMTCDLFILPAEGGKPVNLTRGALDRHVMSYQWEKNGGILFQAADGFQTRLGRVNPAGELKRLPPFESRINPSGPFVSGSGFIAFVGQTAVDMPEMWISKQPGKAERVTGLNDAWKDIKLVRPEIFTYQSFDGLKIEAGLYEPEILETGFRAPLIVLVHGGPAGRWSDRFQPWAQLLVQRGYAVLLPNIRGSTGYGFDFMTANRRDWGGGDFSDVMTGVDDLIGRGVADPQRLGIGGWSYGGYMAAWAVTQTDRFAAAVSGAPMTDLAGEYGTEAASINAYDTWYMGTPYENLELFQDRSPMTYVKKVKTPTLILCGEEDAVDPIGQCRQFYRGLKRYRVETEFVIYPREGHGIHEEKHRVDLLERILVWFEKYIKP